MHKNHENSVNFSEIKIFLKNIPPTLIICNVAVMFCKYKNKAKAFFIVILKFGSHFCKKCQIWSTKNNENIFKGYYAM